MAATLLLTRPVAQSRAFAAACRAAGWTGPIVLAPLLEIVPRPLEADLAAYPTLIFTSANGVASAAGQADLSGRSAVAVGEATARAARAAGLAVRSAGGNVEDLLALVLAARPPAPLCHLRGAHARGNLAQRLREAGVPADEVVVYDQVARPLGEPGRRVLGAGGRVVAPLFSPRTARLLRESARGARCALVPVAISEATAEAWGGAPLPCVAAGPTAEAMCLAVVSAGRT